MSASKAAKSLHVCIGAIPEGSRFRAIEPMVDLNRSSIECGFALLTSGKRTLGLSAPYDLEAKALAASQANVLSALVNLHSAGYCEMPLSIRFHIRRRARK